MSNRKGKRGGNSNYKTYLPSKAITIHFHNVLKLSLGKHVLRSIPFVF